MALELLRHGAYSKRKRRWVRAHHGGARRREHVRGRGAAIVGTSGDLPSAASEKVHKKVPNEGQQCAAAALSQYALLPGLSAAVAAVANRASG